MYARRASASLYSAAAIVWCGSNCQHRRPERNDDAPSLVRAGKRPPRSRHLSFRGCCIQTDRHRSGPSLGDAAAFKASPRPDFEVCSGRFLHLLCVICSCNLHPAKIVSQDTEWLSSIHTPTFLDHRDAQVVSAATVQVDSSPNTPPGARLARTLLLLRRKIPK